MGLTSYQTDIAVRWTIAIGILFLLTLTPVFALDLPVDKAVTEAKGWAFGASARLVAVIVWAVLTVAALMPQVRSVGFGGWALGSLAIILYFASPVFVPKIIALGA